MNELNRLQEKWDNLQTKMTTLECAVLKSKSVNAAAELAAMQSRIEKFEHLETIAQDVNTWLIKSKLGGTTHQRSLAEALYALKGDE